MTDLPLFAFACEKRATMLAERPKGCLRTSIAKFEAMLRRLGVPFVAVDDVKRAIFADSTIESFHFLVYRTEGVRNFMVHLGPRNDRTIEGMREWERVFGDEDFLAVFGRMNPRGDVRYVGLDGVDVAIELAVDWPDEADIVQHGQLRAPSIPSI